MAKLMNTPTSIAGWIVGVAGRDVAAGPTRNPALRTARELGVKGGDVWSYRDSSYLVTALVFQFRVRGVRTGNGRVPGRRSTSPGADPK